MQLEFACPGDFITLFKCNAGVVVMPLYNDEFHYVVFVILFHP